MDLTLRRIDLYQSEDGCNSGCLTIVDVGKKGVDIAHRAVIGDDGGLVKCVGWKDNAATTSFEYNAGTTTTKSSDIAVTAVCCPDNERIFVATGNKITGISKKVFIII